MNTICSLRRRWVCCTIIICSLSLIGAAVFFEAARVKEAKRDTKKVGKRKNPAEIVEAIVNRNKAPKLVDRPSGLPKTVPLFPENYDWKEQKRVRKALDELFQNTSVELWEELVRRSDDSSYCITVVDVKIEDADNESVGGICYELADSLLMHAFEQHLPVDEAKDGEPISLDLGIENLRAWRKKRAKKSLYELQIEVCQMALRVLPKSDIPKDEVEIARSKIEAEIKQLRRGKRPDFGKGSGFFLLPYREIIHDRELAGQIREAVRTGSSENLTTITK